MGGTPPNHMPLALLAASLSRMRSPVTSRSNCAKDSRMLSVSRPIEVVVLNCCVTETKDTPLRSNTSTSLAKSGRLSGEAVDLVDDHGVDLSGLDVRHQAAQRRAFHVAAGVAAVVVAIADGNPAFMPLAGDEGQARVALRFEAVVFLIQPFVSGFAGVDGATLLRRDRRQEMSARGTHAVTFFVAGGFRPKNTGPDPWPPAGRPPPPPLFWGGGGLQAEEHRARPVAAGDAARNRRQALEALPLILEVARAAHQHAMLDVVVDAREDGAGQQALGVASQRLGQDAGFADLFELLAQRGFQTAEGALLNLVGQSALQPAAMVVAGPFIEMRIPQCPEIAHREMGDSGDLCGDRGGGWWCVCRHGRTPL